MCVKPNIQTVWSCHVTGGGPQSWKSQTRPCDLRNHKSSITIMTEKNISILQNTPSSPDLTARDFFLFTKIKSSLGTRFQRLRWSNGWRFKNENGRTSRKADWKWLTTLFLIMAATYATVCGWWGKLLWRWLSLSFKILKIYRFHRKSLVHTSCLGGGTYIFPAQM